MKTTLLSLLSILFFSFSLNLMPIAAADPVLDVNGDPLQAGGRYYIVSAIWGPGGGGLRLQRPGLLVPCPPILVQAPSLVNGDPWTLLPLNRRAGPIQESDLINIRADFSLLCLQNTWWSVSNTEDTETGSYLIDIVNSGPSNFYIQRLSSIFYKLVYVGFNNHTSSVGRQTANGLTRLALDDNNPFRVVFYKADDLKAYLQQM